MRNKLLNFKNSIVSFVQPLGRTLLGITENEVDLLAEIREKGLETVALEDLGLSAEDLGLVKMWNTATFPQKLEQLLKEVSQDSIWTFLTSVSRRYSKMTKVQKQRWKGKTRNQHLLRIKDLVGQCINNDAVDKQSAEEIIVKLYYILNQK